MTSRCETCAWHRYSERKPQSILAKLWRWHTRWCPGWKAYQRQLAQQADSPQARQVNRP